MVRGGTQAGQKLGPGEYITGGNGAFLMQSDGALVVCAALEPASAAGTRCAAGAVPLWSSGTAGHAGAYAVMQQDGVLSVFPRDACPPNNDCRLWQSHTMAKAELAELSRQACQACQARRGTKWP